MPADASIFQNFLRAPKSVQDYDNEAMQAQSNALAMKTQQAQYNALIQQQEEDNLYKSTARGFGTDTQANYNSLIRAGLVPQAQAYQKSSIEAMDKTVEARKKESDLIDARLKQSASLLSEVYTPEQYLAWHEGNHTDPVIGPLLASRGITADQARANIVQALKQPGGLELLVQRSGMGLDAFYKKLAADREFGLNANNELIGADGKVNTTLLGAKKQIAQAGASSVNINNGQKGFENELKLRGDFKQEPVYKAHQEMQSAHGQIKQSLAKASPAGDLAGATKIMKLLDPGSVVRESELGMAMAATGLLDRVQNYASNIISGNKLTPKQRQEFQQLADALYGESVKAYNSKRGEYQKLGAEYGLNADRAVGAPASLAQKPSANGAKFLGFE